MQRRLVNNTFQFFLTRYIASIALCFLTLFVTGKIGDIDFLLGFNDYAAGGTTSTFASNIFSGFSFLGNRYLIICLVSGISSTLIFILLKSFIDKKNIIIWQITLMAPGILIYTNSITKETLFIYPAIAFVILESFYLSGKNSKLFNVYLDFLIKIILLFFMISVRGDLTAPYIILFFLSLIFKNVYFGNIFKNLKFRTFIVGSFFVSLICIFAIIFLNEDYFLRTISYLEYSFKYENNFRPTVDAQFIKSPLNYFYIQLSF